MNTEDDRLRPIGTMSVFQSNADTGPTVEELVRAIQTALWHLDNSDDNPNAGAAANTHSQNGGDECEAPLERAIDVLRGTGLRAKESGNE